MNRANDTTDNRVVFEDLEEAFFDDRGIEYALQTQTGPTKSMFDFSYRGPQRLNEIRYSMEILFEMC